MDCCVSGKNLVDLLVEADGYLKSPAAPSIYLLLSVRELTSPHLHNTNSGLFPLFTVSDRPGGEDSSEKLLTLDVCAGKKILSV